MAKETLNVPEDHLAEFIEIVKAGLAARPDTTPEVREGLEFWCQMELEYIQRLGEGDASSG